MNSLKKRGDRTFSLEPGAKVTGGEEHLNNVGRKTLFFSLLILVSLAGTCELD